MPTARILPDWSMRVKVGQEDPWTYYGGAAGLLNLVEFHGQYTRISTIQAFEEYDYGDYKDRSAGARLVLLRESEFLPQIAGGFFDATGTGLFSTRYIAASKMIRNIDVTIGLGQGLLAGEYTGSGTGEDFLTSDPFRETRLFGGMEWHISPRLTFAAEYDSLDRDNMFGYRNNSGEMFGYRNNSGERVKSDAPALDISVGLKYKLTPHIHTTAACMGGDTLAWSVDIPFDLKPEGFLAWEKSPPYIPGEKLKWQAQEADNDHLSKLLCEELKKSGFKNVSAACGPQAVWLSFENTRHLSSSRALGHAADVCDKLLPSRITTFFLNIKENSTIILSLSTSRSAFQAFRDHRLDREGFLAYAHLKLHREENWKAFNPDGTPIKMAHAQEKRFSFQIDPKITTFLNNRNGFFKHKGFLRFRSGYRPWVGAKVHGEVQWTLFNEYDEVDYSALEDENSVRTDLLDYEAPSDLRVSMLALEQKVALPWSIQGRVAVGAFESAYAGIGAELFRYFSDGLWGMGIESEWVRKRDPDNNFNLRDYPDKWYTPMYLHLYAQVLPSQGIEAGLTVGEFLAGDRGFRVDIRRSFNYFTLGAWYTKTDTDIFDSPKNRGTDQKGVYIRFPFSIFKPQDKPGHLNYAITSFTRDPGAQVRQPDSLYPLSPWSTPDHARRTIEDMRRY